MTRAVTVNFSKKVTQKSDPKGVGAQDMKLGVEGRGKWNFYCMPGTHGTHTYSEARNKLNRFLKGVAGIITQ